MAVTIVKKKKVPTNYDEHLAEDLVAMPVIGKIEVLNKDGIIQKEEEFEINKGVIMKKEEMCKIELNAGKTINLGNYESARIGVSITVPCSRDEIPETFEFARKWVDSKMNELTKDDEE